MKVSFQKRDLVGKKVSKLRDNGVVPVVCYAKNEDAKNYSIEEKALIKLLRTEEVVVDGDGEIKNKKLLLKEVEFHPVTQNPIHADFMFIDEKHVVKSEVPINIVGESSAVKSLGGLLVVVQDSVEVEALPQNLPKHIDVDISSLSEIGSHIKVSDINNIDNVKILNDGDEILVSIVSQTEESSDEVQDSVDMSNIETTGKGAKKDAEENTQE